MQPDLLSFCLVLLGLVLVTIFGGRIVPRVSFVPGGAGSAQTFGCRGERILLSDTGAKGNVISRSSPRCTA